MPFLAMVATIFGLALMRSVTFPQAVVASVSFLQKFAALRDVYNFLAIPRLVSLLAIDAPIFLR